MKEGFNNVMGQDSVVKLYKRGWCKWLADYGSLRLNGMGRSEAGDCAT